MSSIANDGTLVRGTFAITISSVIYALLDYKRSAKSRSEVDYDVNGKPCAASHAEDLEMITGTIRSRSDKVEPPKFIVFAHDGKNWYIKEREKSGSAPGTTDYAVEIWECVTGTVTVT
jgi:hypothetical protein